jgi:hypothetical protein
VHLFPASGQAQPKFTIGFVVSRVSKRCAFLPLFFGKTRLRRAQPPTERLVKPFLDEFVELFTCSGIAAS